ncbi:hypothetical protein BH11BAC1_BH11BAC1_16110 [soil metagenome]
MVRLNILKSNFIFFLLFFSTSISFGQTWVQKLNDYYVPESSYLHPNDIVTGVKDIAISTDNDFFLLDKISADSWEKIYKVSNSGSTIWQIGVGSYGWLAGSFCTRIKPTSDSGFVLLHNYWGQSACTHIDGMIEKYSKDGVLQWTGNYTPYPCFERLSYDAVERSNGGYWVLLDNISYKLDQSGNMIDSSYMYGTKLFEMPNGDLIVQSSNIYRADTLGNVIWSVPASANDAIAVSRSLPYFYLTNGSSVKKISAVNGSILWNKNYNVGTLSTIDITADGGFEAGIGETPSDFFFSSSGHIPSFIMRADSAGDTLWTRNFNFPEYGISALKCLPNGGTIMGSGFLVGAADYLFFDTDYKAFCFTLDSNGHGDIENTSYVWPGDANNNQLLSFVDDALDIMLADGITGPPRLVPDQTYNCCENFGKSSDFALDWNTTFANGVNHKNADFDGNGLVDTNDVNRLALLWYNFFPDTIIIQAPFRFQNPVNGFSTLPEFSLIAEHDTILPDSTLRFYIVAGSQGNPVDSIYGLAFSVSSSTTDVGTIGISLFDCDLGTTSANLFTISNVNNFGGRSFGMSCRYNHQNAYNLYDTIGVITVHASSVITTLTPFQLHIDEFKAIRWDESIIPFNLLHGSAVVNPGPVSVEENSNLPFKIFPNPANGLLNIATGNLSLKNIEIVNSTGQVVRKLYSSERTIIISTQDLVSGIYNASILSGETIRHFSFAVQH